MVSKVSPASGEDQTKVRRRQVALQLPGPVRLQQAPRQAVAVEVVPLVLRQVVLLLQPVPLQLELLLLLLAAAPRKPRMKHLLLEQVVLVEALRRPVAVPALGQQLVMVQAARELLPVHLLLLLVPLVVAAPHEQSRCSVVDSHDDMCARSVQPHLFQG